MLVKIIIVLLLLFIVFNLFKALFVMLKNDPDGPSMSQLLGRRVLFSAIAMIVIIAAIMLGLITPNSGPF
ncbi:DUF2909 family protein [Pseudoalteromonas denitrificans]|uniref:DUF2909 domain-containing protein n=1 Tax=Pseudoalteromonas denitrificans DSM 6059 TaxID=1123010 RepID=A0A1I1RXB9_9GAMM|nr:DUF2909 family protein [Pseudoalteromonas denitrificans]SFD36153.1 Protein of unknown function [Pseudoalteromonas denitrificans DSM 6059]